MAESSRELNFKDEELQRAVFNPEMLQLARESQGLSQSDLAESLGVSQGWLSKVEHGVVVPGDDLVGKLVQTLGYPKSFFFLPDRVYGLPPAFHRKRKSLASRILDRIHAEVNLTRIHLRRLLPPLEIDEVVGIPSLDIDQYGTPELIAHMVRAAWQLPRGPIRNLIATMEEMAGAIVVLIDFGTREIDGIGVQYTGTPPMFFLNSSAPVDRRRFTLAHELGHLVMHALPSDTMEAEADRFASELLMPEADIRGQLHSISLERLAALKPVWKVSMSALLRRAYTLHAITPNSYKYWSVQLGKAGYRTREPVELDLPEESPQTLADVFQVYANDLGYSPTDLAKALHASTKIIRRMYPIDNKSLRLVG